MAKMESSNDLVKSKYLRGSGATKGPKTLSASATEELFILVVLGSHEQCRDGSPAPERLSQCIAFAMMQQMSSD